MLQPSISFAVAQSSNAQVVRDVDLHSRVASADEVLWQAWGVLAERVKPVVTLSSPEDVKNQPRRAIGMLEHEVFCAVYLDTKHRVIELWRMLRVGDDAGHEAAWTWPEPVDQEDAQARVTLPLSDVVHSHSVTLLS